MVTQLDHWMQIRDIYNQYRFHEAAERGYDADASQEAFGEYVRQCRAYELIYGVEWDERDVLIDVSNQALHNYQGDGKIVWLK